MAQLVRDLEALGLPANKAAQASNKALAAALQPLLAEAYSITAGEPALLQATIGALFDVATKLKITEASDGNRRLLVQRLLAGPGHNIDTPEKTKAALAYIKAQPPTAPTDEAAFCKAAGVGVEVDPATVYASAKEIVAEMEERLQQMGYGLKEEVIRKVSEQHPFASGQQRRNAAEQALAELLGPDPGDAKERHKKALEAERKKKKQQQQQLLQQASPAVAEDSNSHAAAAPPTVEAVSEGVPADAAKATGQVITPWAVQAEGGVNYDLLLAEFGTQALTETELQRMRNLNIPIHHFLRRKIFFSHRDFDVILDHLERKEPVYLYTGRGPSSQAMHLGHLIPFLFTKYLQDSLGVRLVIQMTDDEKYLFKQSLTLDFDPETGVQHLLRENAKDIIALGFKREATFIFSDLDFMGGEFYKNVVRVQRHININQANKTFGFDLSSSIGQVAFPAVQASPSFPTSFPGILDPQAACLIPCAIDQDPYFRLTRDVAPKLRYKKPSLLHSKFFPAMEGISTKMSSSSAAHTIFLTDTAEQIHEKIHKHAFSGGPGTKKELEEKGANLDIDVAYQYLTFFLEDDEELAHIAREYGSGRMTTRAVKDRLVQVLQALVAKHQEARAKVTEAEIDYFMNMDKFAAQHARA